MRKLDFGKVISKKHFIEESVERAWLGKVDIVAFCAFSRIDSNKISSSGIFGQGFFQNVFVFKLT